MAGDWVQTSWLKPWLSSAGVILAADGAADLVIESGCIPDYLVGDLDSASVEARAISKTVVELEDQDFTDCEKLLQFATSIGINQLVLCGAQGSRIDHMLHALHCVARWEGDCLIAYEKMLARVLLGPATFQFWAAGTVSVIPLEFCGDVSVLGVQWPVNLADMKPTGFSSISNRGHGEVTVSLASGVLVVIWEYDGLPPPIDHEL